MPALIRRRQPEPRTSRVHTPHQIRALRASGAALDLGSKTDISIVTRYRQPWQERALDYLDEIGELRYATKLLENVVKKVGFFPATYLPDADEPQPVEDGEDKNYAAVAHDALDRIGNPGIIGQLASATMGAFKVPGECWMRGYTNGADDWCMEIRSISEVAVHDRQIVLRDAPGNGSAASWRDGEPLGPGDFFARLWTPSRRWRMLADSPVRVAIPTALEAISLLNKEIAATASSRLASAGLLLLPDTLTILTADATAAGYAEDDPFMAMLIEAATEAIKDPGSAAAALPIIAKGPAEAIKEARHMLFGRQDSAHAEEREWALLRLATTLDLPPELLTGGIGKSSNHWSAFLLDDVKWRDHVEPAVQDIVDAWTAAYYRPYLTAAGVPDDVVARSTIWYDPTRAIVKSDRSQAAADAYDRVEISGAALREHLGFREDEAPDDDERLMRAAEKSVLDAAAALAILQGKDPGEIAEAAAPQPVPPQLAPTGPDDPGGDSGDGNDVGPPNGGELPAQDPGEKPPAEAAAAVRLAMPALPVPLAIAASRTLIAAAPISGRAAALSRRLLRIDQTLRAELRQAAEDTVRRALEKTGARLVTKVRRDSVAAAAIRDVPRWQVPARLATLGPAVTAALGLDDQQTLEAELAVLALLWRRRVQQGQEQSVDTAAELLGADVAVLLDRAGPTLRADAEAGWRWLADSLARRMQDTLTQDLSKDIEASRLVPAGIVRGALAIAGGYNHGTSAGLTDDGRPVDPSDPPGQIGTGRTITGLLDAGGAQLVTFEWVHGMAADPFQPHVDLDGETFTDWTGPELANADPFPDFGGYFPGDHAGCSCDVLTVWDGPGDTANVDA